jgi:energy-converting hydrogenase Eha subunit C
MTRTGSNIVYDAATYLMDILAIVLALFWLGTIVFIAMEGYLDFAGVLLVTTVLVVAIALLDEFGLRE